MQGWYFSHAKYKYDRVLQTKIWRKNQYFATLILPCPVLPHQGGRNQRVGLAQQRILKYFVRHFQFSSPFKRRWGEAIFLKEMLCIWYLFLWYLLYRLIKSLQSNFSEDNEIGKEDFSALSQHLTQIAAKSKMCVLQYEFKLFPEYLFRWWVG